MDLKMVSGIKNAYAICTLIKKKVQVFSLDYRYCNSGSDKNVQGCNY